MKKERLNHKVVKGLEAEDEKYVEYWESTFHGGSFGIRISPRTHRKKFVLQYQNDKQKQKRMTLGEFNPNSPDHMTVSEARKKAREIISEVQKGNEPVEKRNKTKKTSNFESLVETFLNTYGQDNLSDSTLQEYRRMAEKDLIPNWGNMKPQEISRNDIIQLLEKIAEDRGAKTIADRTRSLIHKIFNWAIERNILDSNPCTGVQKRNEDTRRERTLTPDEISDLWLKTEDENEPFKSLTRFILLTGQRFGETRKSKWSNIYQEPSMDCKVWKIPSEHAKNNRQNIVPLPPLALEVLDDVREAMSQDTRYVFPSPKNDGEPIKWLQNARKRLCDRMNFDENTSEKGFRFHDLRRTCANELDNLGVDRITVGKLLNHKSIDQTVTAGYIPRKRLREKKEAIFQWNQHVRDIIGIDPRDIDQHTERQDTLFQETKKLEQSINGLDPDEGIEQELTAQLNTIKSQLDSNDPSRMIIEECKKNIREELEKEIGEEKANELLDV